MDVAVLSGDEFLFKLQNLPYKLMHLGVVVQQGLAFLGGAFKRPGASQDIDQNRAS